MSDNFPSGRVAVPGSDRVLPVRATDVGTPHSDEPASVSIVVRPKASVMPVAAALAATNPSERAYLSREAFADVHGADPADVDAVERFALSAGLSIAEADLARRTVVVAGTLGTLSAAFEATLRLYQLPRGELFRGRRGVLTVPAELADIVVGVFGLDDRPQARAQFRRAAQPGAAAPTSYAPTDVAAAYNYPAGDGRGQTIAIVELGGGYAQTDLDTFFSGLGSRTPVVTSVSVDGGANAPTGNPNSADAEVLLDIEVAGAIAPGAAVVVYFAPNTDQGFLDAITTAIHDATNKPQVLSISWGGPEPSWTAQALQNFDAAFAAAATLGVTVLCAAGDNGSNDGVGDAKAHVDFPASSPHVLGCGGTRLELSSGTITSETVWNDGPGLGATGGGISDAFDLPSWQQNAGIPVSANPGSRVGRGVPDVSGDADPQTGYAIYVDGTSGVVGGTSAVSPLWAGLVARINATSSQPLGFLNALLYTNPAVLRDITSGNNGAYAAQPGWDACTGLGSPDGTKIAALATK